MQKFILAGTFAIGALSASSVFAFPVTSTDHGDNGIQQVRTVCDEDGRCFDRRTDVGSDIARGVLRGVEGRSVYRDRDYDRGYRDRDHYRGREGYRPRRDYDDE